MAKRAINIPDGQRYPFEVSVNGVTQVWQVDAPDHETAINMVIAENERLQKRGRKNFRARRLDVPQGPPTVNLPASPPPHG